MKPAFSGHPRAQQTMDRFHVLQPKEKKKQRKKERKKERKKKRKKERKKYSLLINFSNEMCPRHVLASLMQHKFKQGGHSWNAVREPIHGFQKIPLERSR